MSGLTVGERRDRYTPRGTTWKACHGCGQEVNHLINQVCYDCARAIRDAKALREQEQERQAKGDTEAVVAPRDHHALFSYHVSNGGDWRDRQQNEALRTAMMALLDALVVPDARNGGHYTLSDPFIPTYGRSHSPYSGGYGVKLALPAGIPALFDALDSAIRAMLTRQYEIGKEEGSSLLTQLAAGAVTVEDFNQATQSGDKKAGVVLARSEGEEN